MAARSTVRLVIGALVITVAACGSPGPSTAPGPTSTSTTAPATPSPVSVVSSSPGPATAPSSEPEQGIRWARSGMGLEVGVLKVPLDVADPGGREIVIPLARRAATDQANRVGTLLFIAGGPGDPGTDVVQDALDRGFPDSVLERFDLVSFDPRGTPGGTGLPRVDCPSDAELEARIAALVPAAPADMTVDDVQAWMALIRPACEAGSDGMLPYLDTTSTVADIERIREALGEEQLSIIGGSWGTLTGALYAEAHPDRVRALVLDAPLDPALDHLAFTRDKAKAAQAMLDGFLAWCANAQACAEWAKGDPRAALDAMTAAAVKAPADLSAYELAEGIFTGLLANTRDEVAAALLAAEGGDPTTLHRWANPDVDPDQGSYALSVLCPDLAAPSDPAAYTTLADELRASAPDYAYWVVNAADCVGWPQAAPRAVGPVDAAGAPAALILSGTRDPITPHAWAQALEQELAAGTLLSRHSSDHGSLFRGDACIDAAVVDYLVDLTVPVKGTTCD